MIESKIEQKAVDLVWKWLGIEGEKLKIIGNTGYPDRIFWMPGGIPLMIEFKAPGEKPRPKQLEVHKKLINLGYKVEVHDNEFDAFQAVIQAVDTARLSEESLKVLIRAGRQCALLRSRLGEDGHHLGSDQVPEEQESP